MSSPVRRRRRLDAGYTLLEMAAVIGIVLVLSVAAVATVRSVRKADISTSAARLSASIRYLYDLAVLNNRPYRLVIDLNENAYWGELAETADCGDAALLPGEEERKFGVRGEGVASRGAGASAGQGTAGGGARLDGGGSGDRPAGTLAGAAEEAEEAGPALRPKDNLLTRRQLPKGIVFGMVMTSHQDEPTEEGRGEVYFFPSGYVERAYISLKRDDDVYTIETVPLKGTGRVHNQELDPRDLLDRT